MNYDFLKAYNQAESYLDDALTPYAQKTTIETFYSLVHKQTVGRQDVNFKDISDMVISARCRYLQRTWEAQPYA